jgi:DeoR/GlpR family transcriptional regulator of sugar metabolism
VTNSVIIIQEFCLFPAHFILLSLGGNFNCQLNAFLGRTAVETLNRLRLNKAFISAFGITVQGISTYHEEHAHFLKHVLQVADKAYLLIDSGKFGRSGIFPIVDLSKLDAVISEQEIPDELGLG